MKILHIVDTLDPSGGGVTEAVIQFAGTLTEAGHDNAIVTLDNPAEGFPAGKAPVYNLGPARTSWSYSAKLKPWLLEHAQSYDCAVIHGLWKYQSLAVRSVFKRFSLPYFVFTHGMLDVWFKQHYPIKHLKKWLFWPWCEYRVLRDARAVIFTNENERLSSQKSFWLYRCNEKVVRYGILLPEYEPETAGKVFLHQFPELHDKRFLLFLGRIHVKKGLDMLAKAWLDLPEATRPTLVLAGPNQEPEVLEALQKQTKTSGDFHYIGMLQGELKWGALAAAEALILPSHQENFGLVVAESMIMGTPVLISDKVNIWQEVTEARAGLVAPDTLDGTRELLKNWEAMSTSEKEAMASRARPACEAMFDLRKNTSALEEVLKS